MYATCVCNTCHKTSNLNGNFIKEDLRGTPLEYLLTPDFKDKDFDNWFKQMLEEHKIAGNGEGIWAWGGTTGVYDEKTNTMKTPEFLLPDEFDRWSRDGEKCPLCGSSDTSWF